MTYGQAKKDFMLFAVFVPVKNKKGKIKPEQVDSVPDDTEGVVGAFDANQDSFSVAPRLCFIVSEVREGK